MAYLMPQCGAAVARLRDDEALPSWLISHANTRFVGRTGK
jgi:hypothetical protein